MTLANNGQRNRTFKRWAGLLLSLEDILCGLCKLLLPLHHLFNGQLGRKKEMRISRYISKGSNAEANQLLTPSEAAASAFLFSISWSFRVNFLGNRHTRTSERTSAKQNAKRKPAHHRGEKPKGIGRK